MADYFDQSNELITSILKETIALVKDKWEKLILTAEYSETDVVATAVYKFERFSTNLTIPDNIKTLLLDLKIINSTDGKGSLKKVIFETNAAGKFNVKYDY